MFGFNDLNFDIDGDGVLDSHAEFVDIDGDGIADYVQIDFDGDGSADAVFFDSNHDGMWDTGVIDLDMEELIEAGFMDTKPIGPVFSTYAEDLGNFDPSNADMNRVSGNPESAMEEWEYQGDTGRCALYAQKFVIEELTDMEIDIEELARLAEEKGWFSEDSGTSMLNMDKVLDYYGLDSEMSFHNDITDIQECLESGGKIIVSIDADEIWYGEEDNLFTPGDGANHAVEVIGIDQTNPDEPMVILNDSGNPNGCGEMVPLETFIDAWEDSNYQMITCMDPGA